MSSSHANRGRAFERQLEALLEWWATRGLCYWQRNYPEARLIKGALMWTAAGPPDYTLLAGGRTFIVEAKQQTGGVRWPYTNLHHHQAKQLDNADRMGGHSILLLRWEEQKTTTLLLWRDVREKWWAWHHATKVGRAVKGSASLPFSDARDDSVWSGRGADFLAALLQSIPQ